MKRTTTLLLLLALCVPLFAQQGRAGHSQKNPCRRMTPPPITEVVSDLSQLQKKRIETITEGMKEKMGKIDRELCEVRRQIQTLLDRDGDNSKALYPLFEKEGDLMVERSKTMYRSRQEVEKVLTKEQLKEFRSAIPKPKPHRHQAAAAAHSHKASSCATASGCKEAKGL